MSTLLPTVTRYDLHHVLSFDLIPPCFTSIPSPSSSIVAYHPPPGFNPASPRSCPNRVYVHSNFASSTAYLLKVLMPVHKPETEFCLVKDDTVTLQDGYDEEVR